MVFLRRSSLQGWPLLVYGNGFQEGSYRFLTCLYHQCPGIPTFLPRVPDRGPCQAEEVIWLSVGAQDTANFPMSLSHASSRLTVEGTKHILCHSFGRALLEAWALFPLDSALGTFFLWWVCFLSSICMSLSCESVLKPLSPSSEPPTLEVFLSRKSFSSPCFLTPHGSSGFHTMQHAPWRDV